ncbi:MAG: hypothetical protein KKA73_18595 [Chloroflexi bacterium]|nr:hypothetical protein [Chloroflexota bacterium]MBU1749698.1 hypothetical protein [Chloroflexota bacterium]
MSWNPLARRWIAPSLIVLAAVVAVLVWLSPADQRLSDVVKLVYVHGALVRTGTLAFWAAGVIGLVALVGRRQAWYARGRAIRESAILIWLVYLVSSGVVTYLAWGVVLYWGEPRVQLSFQILIAALLAYLVGWLVRRPWVSALADVFVALLVAYLLATTGLILHPVDPIGQSGSLAIQGFFVAITLGMVAIAIQVGRGLYAWHNP